MVAPGSTTGGDDVILGSAANPLVDPQVVPAPTEAAAHVPADAAATGEVSTLDAAAVSAVPVATAADPPPETVTVTVVTVDKPAADPVSSSAVPAVPAAAAQRAPDLPLAEVAPSLPLALGG